MAIRHSITLSTSEPNNEVGNLKIRQGDEQTQTLVANITENGVPKPFTGLQPFFCAKLGQTAGLGIVEQKVTGTMNPANGTLEYVMQPEDWQKIGRQTGYFSFRKMKNAHEWTEQFSTRDFAYNVIPSAIGEIREVKKDGSTYVWTIEDMLRLFKEYIATGKTDWEEFVEQNREILESVDPGGKILGEIISARGGLPQLEDRLDATDAQLAETANRAQTFSNFSTPQTLTVSANNKRKPFISFVDDDIFSEAYTKFLPMLESKGFVGTLAAITNEVGNIGRMTKDQLLESQKRGHEIASHTHDHLGFESSNLTPDEIEYQCKHSKELLTSWGLRTEHMIYPGGQSGGNAGIERTKKYYKAGYTAGNVNNDNQNGLITNNFLIARINVDTGNFTQIKTQIDRCVTEKNWLILMSHVSTHTPEKLAMLQQVIDYIATLDIEVGTLNQGYEIFGSTLDVGSKRYMRILNDGDFYSNVIGSVFKNPSDGYVINENTPLTYFEDEKFTFSSFRIEDGGIFPISNSGLLETYRSTKQAPASYQVWKPYRTTQVFKRYWSGETITLGTWDNWVEQGVYKKSLNFILPSTNLMSLESKTVSVDLTDFLGDSATTDRIPHVLSYRASIVDGIQYTHRIELGILYINFYNPLSDTRNMYANDWDITIFV